MEISTVIAENDQLKELLKELHERISFLEDKSLNHDDSNDKPYSYKAEELFGETQKYWNDRGRRY